MVKMSKQKSDVSAFTGPYPIIIPSKGRCGRVTTLDLVPDAIICVDENDAAEYTRTYGASRILVHPVYDRMPIIRNWILDKAEEIAPGKPVVMIDDDLVEVRSLVWDTPRAYGQKNLSDSRKFIGTLFDNAVQVLTDLDAGLYCWGRIKDPAFSAPWSPFGMVSYAGGAFVVNANRSYRFDESYRVVDDVDFSVQCLLHDRFLLCDNRFSFMFKDSFSNPGGCQTLRTGSTEDHDMRRLKEKWGDYVNISMVQLNSRIKNTKKRSANRRISIKVNRTSTAAIKV